MKIKTKLYFVLLIVSIIPILMISGIALIYTHQFLAEIIGVGLRVMAKKEAENITNSMNRKIEEVKNLAANPQLVEAIKGFNQNYQGKSNDEIVKNILSIDQIWIDNKGRLPLAEKILNNNTSQLLKTIKSGSPQKFGEIFVTDSKGAVVAMTKVLSDYYQSDETWWEVGWNNGQGGLFIDDRGYDDSVGAIVVGVVVPVLDHNKPIGVLKINYKVKDILDMVSSTQLGISDFSFLARSHGQMLASSENYPPEGLTPTELTMLKTQEAGWIRDRHKNIDTIMGFAPIKIDISYRVPNEGERKGISGEKWESTTWVFAIDISQEEVLSPLDNLLVIFVMVALFTLLLSLFLTLVFGKQILTPIDQLTEGVIGITQGNLDLQIEVRHQDEIGILAKAFNQLVVKLKTTLESLREEIRVRSHAELELQKAHDDLERRVEVRTRDLAETNRLLQAEVLYRKEAETKKTELLKEVEHINKELEEFAYVVSHDLKTPLRAINSLAGWIKEDYRDKIDEEGRKNLDLLTNRVEKLHQLIDGILQYSRAGRMVNDEEDVDFNEVVKEAVDLMGPPKQIEITWDSLPTLHCDRTRIRQVFMNLIGNAVKHMDKPKGKVQVSCETFDDHYQFSVSDNGPGIEDRFFDKIFQIFQTLGGEQTKKGTGIGLSIVKKIVHYYQGEIWVQSELGQGSTFYFTLPKRDLKNEG